MNGITFVLFGLVVFTLGYKLYSKYLGEKVFKLNKDFITPANEFEDGVDFVPTSKYVLFGHHFTSIAGAAPIVGPTIAIYWGWMPALLWVVFGTVFAAGIHDFGSIVISIRHRGNSMGTLANKILGKRAKVLFLFIILILLLMVNAVFAWVISKLFISFPSSILPVFIQIPVAVWVGYRVYKKQGSILIPSIIGLLIMYGTAILTSQYSSLHVDLPTFFAENNITWLTLNPESLSYFTWIMVLMVYGYIASVLPVWTLLQPRDFINSHQLIIGLGILYAGVFILNPDVNVPVFEAKTDKPWFPLLFITIACGAISGFHGLVASGTTSKQLDKETDARFVGYLGALGEGSLALIALIAVATVFTSQAEFSSVYNNFSSASGQGIGIFIKGAAHLATGVGIPQTVAQTIVAVIVISFAATSLDTAMRLLRYIINELGQEYNVELLTRKHVATTLGVTASALIAILPEGPKGFGSGGFLLWPLFGTGNQILAGITLLIITLWLKSQKRNYLPTLIPMLFLLVMTIWAMVSQVFFEWPYEEGKLLLIILGSIILCFALWILLEGILTLKKNRNIKVNE